MSTCDAKAVLYFGVRLPSDPRSTVKFDRMLDDPNGPEKPTMDELNSLGLELGVTHEHHLAIKEYTTEVYDGDTAPVEPNVLVFEMGESDKLRAGLRLLEVEEGDCEDGIGWHLAVGVL